MFLRRKTRNLVGREQNETDGMSKVTGNHPPGLSGGVRRSLVTRGRQLEVRGRCLGGLDTLIQGEVLGRRGGRR